MKNRQRPVVQSVSKCTIHVGDWCVFMKENNNQFLLGRVLSLGYLSGKSKDLNMPLTEHNPNIETENVSALCNW